jgi:GT2 family glycosyltransferase
MRTAVVILNWNGLPWLKRFLPGVLANSAGAEVIVGDSASTDGSVAWLRAEHPGVKRVELPQNLGFAGGYNAVLAGVEAERYVLLNPDVEVRPGWLDALNSALDREPRMAACQPKVLALNDPQRFEHAGAAGGFIDRNGYPFCRGRIFEITERDEGQYDDAREVFWATGACMMVRADAFHAAGGFDASLFAHMEEIDLCWRLRRQGWRIGYTPATAVLHAGGGALRYGSPLKTYLNFRNSLIVLTKNSRHGPMGVRLPHRLVLDWIAALKFLFEGHARHAWQVLRAHAHFLARLRTVLRQRRALMALEHDPDLTGLYLRSIAYDRFILGWKSFSRLDPRAFVQRKPSR